MTKIRSSIMLIGVVVFAAIASAKTEQQLSLERDVTKFGQSIKASRKYKMVTSVKAGGTISGINEPSMHENPFVMVNSAWQRLSNTRKRQVAAELFKRWRPYCTRSSRYASIYFQTKSDDQPVAQCSEDDGCALGGDTDE